MQFGKVVCFVFSDGSVEYRDRATWNEVYNSGDLTRLTTLNEIGMVFSQDAPCKQYLPSLLDAPVSLAVAHASSYIGLQVAFSPTNCSMAQIMENGKVKWNCLHHVGSEVTRASQDRMSPSGNSSNYDEHSADWTAARYTATVAALTVIAASANLYSMNYDDLLAIARPFAADPRMLGPLMSLEEQV